MRRLYAVFAYAGAMTPAAVFLYGFRYDPAAPHTNFLFNGALYAAYMAVHLVMTRPWFKRAVFGRPEGSLRERQLYVTVSIVTWVLLFVLHRLVPGPALMLPAGTVFIGICLMLVCVLAQFEGATFERLNGLFGVPGSEMSHSHGAEAPLLTEGPYASVRHPMYRAAILKSLASLLVHPNAAQLLWTLLFSATFFVWVPFEEAHLRAARGEAYRAYTQSRPYRLFPRVW